MALPKLSLLSLRVGPNSLSLSQPTLPREHSAVLVRLARAQLTGDAHEGECKQHDGSDGGDGGHEYWLRLDKRELGTVVWWFC